MIELFQLMKWPLVACLVLPWLLVYLGLHIVRRGVIFVDLALAQVAALGACVALLIGYDVHDWQSYALSIVFTLIGASVFTFTRMRQERVPQEALIGIVYVAAAAAGILVLSKSPGGKEELQRSLVGELLVVTPEEIARTFGLFVLVGIVHFLFRDKFLRITYDCEDAERAGLAVRSWDFLFYALFGLVVTSFVHMGGVLLTFSYLIVPAVCANFLVNSLRAQLIVGWSLASLAGIVSLFVTAKVDLPIGATIVCGLGITLLLVGIVAGIRNKRE